MAVCPFCEGEVSASAQKCRHCGEWLKQDREERAVLKLTCPECRAQVWDPRRHPDGRVECHFCSRRFTEQEGRSRAPDRRVSPGAFNRTTVTGGLTQDPPPAARLDRESGGFVLPVGLIALIVAMVGFVVMRVAQTDDEPTNERARSAVAEVTRTSTPALLEFIPGLTAVDVTGNVERRGLTCQGPTTEPAGVSWFCSDGTFVVSASGASPTRIRAVSAAAVGADDQTAAAFLGYIATLPYDTSQPEEARTWVEEELGAGSGGVRTFGSARYSVSGPELGRSLDITALDR